MIDYLVENVNAGHAGDLLVCSCYETVKVYHVTRVFGVKLGGDTLWCRSRFGVKVCAVALDFQLDILLNSLCEKRIRERCRSVSGSASSRPRLGDLEARTDRGRYTRPDSSRAGGFSMVH
nr:MAG TPA: hypothetical protein [Caudoviricetes sp.]